MHLKSRANSMASLRVDDQDQRPQRKNSLSSNSHNNNNASTSTSTTTTAATSTNAPASAITMTAAAVTSEHNNNNNNAGETKNHKRLHLEARKTELEKKLNEKNWLLQEIQKQESMLLNGHREFLSLDELFETWSRQYRQEQQQAQVRTSRSGSCSSAADSAIMRRKNSNSTTSKENHLQDHQNRNSGLSNRSSEYDNFRPAPAVSDKDKYAIGLPLQPQQQHQLKSALKKRPAPLVHPTATTFMQAQRTTAVQQALHATDQFSNLARHHSQPLVQPYNKLRARSPPQSQQQMSTQVDGLSMYSLNSASVATMHQHHMSPQQQPIIMQCDKYYMSPTQQSYDDGGFIKSSCNIKEYVSPLNSPAAQESMLAGPSSKKHQQHDDISLAPSYMSMEGESAHQSRWHSQSHIGAPLPFHSDNKTDSAIAAKSHSTDMLVHAPSNASQHGIHHQRSAAHATLMQPAGATANFLPDLRDSKPKTHDEVSLSSLNSEKKNKTKQWLESSLDSPIIHGVDTQAKQVRERCKLSSHSMSVGARHYSMSTQRNPVLPNPEPIQHHDDKRYTKLSQSTSHLNTNQNPNMRGISAPYALEPLDIPPFICLPPKPNSLRVQTPPPPPRPAPLGERAQPLLAPAAVAATAAALAPDIRIESPKNMTVVQQATFQPYKEVTKPFEMSDFYKYSTKFKQKESTKDRNGN